MKLASLFRLFIIPLKHTTMRSCRLANSNISKANIRFLAQDTPTNTNHETNLNREATFHIVCYCYSRCISHDASQKTSNNKVVNSNAAKGVVIQVIFLRSQLRMWFVKHCYHCCSLCMQGADDSDLIVFFRICSHFKRVDVLCSYQPSLPSLIGMEKSLLLQSCDLNNKAA